MTKEFIYQDIQDINNVYIRKEYLNGKKYFFRKCRYSNKIYRISKDKVDSLLKNRTIVEINMDLISKSKDIFYSFTNELNHIVFLTFDSKSKVLSERAEKTNSGDIVLKLNLYEQSSNIKQYLEKRLDFL